MKMLKFWQSLLIAIVFIPTAVMAQPIFNNTYSFQTPYTNSVHTDGELLSNGLIAEGGTIVHPMFGAPNVVEIGLVTPFGIPAGLMIPPTFFYADVDGFDLEAVDLVESTQKPNQVIQVADYWDAPAGFWRIVVFKTDPATGAVAWALKLGVGLNEDLRGAAITSDMNGNHYVLGNTSIAGGTVNPYLTRITNGGFVVWEARYFDPAMPNTSHLGIDLLYSPALNSIVFTADRTRPNGLRDGIVTFEVGAGNPCNLFAISHLPVLSNTRDFNARDMSLMNNGEYAIVGNINNNPNEAFLLRYMPGLIPAGAFSTVYVNVNGNPVWFTGVKPLLVGGGGMAVSLEWINLAGVLVPGMIELGPAGFPVNPGIVWGAPPPAYIASRGLIDLGVNAAGTQGFAVKGAVNFGISSLSLFAHNAPFGPPNADFCEEEIKIDFFNDQFPFNIPFQCYQVTTDKPFNIYVDKVRGRVYDCFGTLIGNFKESAATGIEENAEALGMSIYPNPTDGNFTLELSDEMTEIYQTGEIYNALGEVVMTFNVNNTIEKVDLTKQVPGIYLIRLKASNGNVSDAKRIMVK